VYSWLWSALISIFVTQKLSDIGHLVLLDTYNVSKALR
jgi:hypothetical protein